MNCRSSKLKAQSLKETPTASGQAVVDFEAWELIEDERLGSLVLRDWPLSANGQPWDLLERTAIFGEKIVRFSKKIPRNPTNNRLIAQVVGAGTSVGANYCEANEAVSKKDFKNTVSRCVKEAKETKFFLRMIVTSEPSLAEEARPLYREAHELLRIFGSMRHKDCPMCSRSFIFLF